VDHANADRLWHLPRTHSITLRTMSVSCIARSSSIGPKPARSEPD
jgi:hypothetical protein